jgi:hypothetical protein
VGGGLELIEHAVLAVLCTTAPSGPREREW